MYKLLACVFLLTFISCSKSPQEIEQERQLLIKEFKEAVKFHFQMLNNDANDLQDNKNPSYITYDYNEKSGFVLLISDFPKEPLRAKVVYEKTLWLKDPHGGHFEKNIYPEEGYWRPNIKYEVDEFFEYDRKLLSLGIAKEHPLERPWQSKETPNPLTNAQKEGLPEQMKGEKLKKKPEQDTDYR